MQRFREDGERTGISYLYGHPRIGRPRKVSIDTVRNIIRKTLQESSSFFPVQIQQKIKQETGVEYHITYTRKLLHRLNFSSKTSSPIHVRQANKKAAHNWKYNTKNKILCLKKAGFTTTRRILFFVRGHAW